MTPGAKFCDNLLSSGKNSRSTENNLIGNIEKGIGDAGNASYILSKATSNVSESKVFSKTMGTASEALGGVSTMIDLFQLMEEPSFSNSRSLAASSWGLVDPFGGMFLQSYYNYLDTVNDYFGNGNPRSYSLVSLNSHLK